MNKEKFKEIYHKRREQGLCVSCGKPSDGMARCEKCRQYERWSNKKVWENTSEEKKKQVRECQKKWHEENKDRVKEYQKQWRQENKEKMKEYTKRWKEKHDE